MTTLVSLTGKSTYAHPDEIVVPGDGTVQIFVNGDLGPGAVLLLLKDSTGAFHPYPEFTFNRNTAVEIDLFAGDVLKVEFRNCVSAGLELRQ